MGMLSMYFKPNFLGLLKCLNSLNWFIVFFSLINLSVCIYEDQIGKFDWRQAYVGRIKFAQFDTVSTAKKIIVATEENVLAALHLKTGQVVWRHVFESTSTGNIQLLHVAEKVVTVSGSNPYLVRGWDSATGVLLWEWSLTLQNDDTAEFSEWWVQQGLLVHMLPVFGSHIEVSMYNLLTGQNRGATSKLPAVWINDGCVLTAPYYTCISGGPGSQLLLTVDVTSNAVQIISKPLSDYIPGNQNEGSLRSLDGNSVIPGFIVDDKKILFIQNNKFEVFAVEVADQSASVSVVDSASGPLVLQTWNDDEKGFTLTAHGASSGAAVPEVQWAGRGAHVPEPALACGACSRVRDQLACRLLVTAGDDASLLLQQEGRVLWTREEALANVAAVEFVDLPVSDLDAAIESEFDQKEGSIWAAFSRRLQTQFQQLQTLIQGFQKTETSSDDQPSELVRDYFNLHKIIVLVTDVGKIFGMDNLSGAILWRYYEPNLDTEGVLVFTRRSSRHPPHDAYITIVGKQEDSGNGFIISLNPIRGTLTGEGSLRLPAQLLQAALLPRAGPQRLRPIVLLDKDENVQILPESSASLVENMYMYVAERNTAKVQGYAIKYDGQRAHATRTWSVRLGGEAGGEAGGAAGGWRVVRALPQRGRERARSAGRVLADRSVLYKHLNPNLVLFVAEGPDHADIDMVVATCVDAVSGAVSCAQAHRRARATPLAVHTDNSIAYVYYNDKQRRTEIATMELYEGKQRWVPAGAAFSSLSTTRAAGVERQAYILAAAATAATTTVTQRSLTDKHVLLALSTGAIVEMPWAYLEPRRPLGAGAVAGGGEREEGLAAYTPELPLAAEAVLNYNQSLARVTALHAAPAGLESTSLVLATGLDLFYTRVAPSKTFDLLKDDFDYYLITIVLAALVVASYSTKYFASRKMLKLAWK